MTITKKVNWASGLYKHMLKKEAREHPTLGKATVKQIVLDHLKGKKK